MDLFTCFISLEVCIDKMIENKLFRKTEITALSKACSEFKKNGSLNKNLKTIKNGKKRIKINGIHALPQNINAVALYIISSFAEIDFCKYLETMCENKYSKYWESFNTIKDELIEKYCNLMFDENIEILSISI